MASSKDIFTDIYARGVWGRAADPAQPYFSGGGSHDPSLVSGYVGGVRALLSSFAKPPRAVDLGCGDFAVGVQLADLCERYVACDVVEPLIAWNRERYGALTNVEFQTLDLTSDPLPEGDVAMVRQVLQHLSNADIAAVVEKILARYRYLVVAEHLPSTTQFAPNLDKPTGHDIRLMAGSGVVLTYPPFNMRPLAAKVIAEAPDAMGRIVTIAYQLR